MAARARRSARSPSARSASRSARPRARSAPRRCSRSCSACRSRSSRSSRAARSRPALFDVIEAISRARSRSTRTLEALDRALNDAADVDRRPAAPPRRARTRLGRARAPGPAPLRLSPHYALRRDGVSRRPACAACAGRARSATSCARRTLDAGDLVLPLFVESGLEGRSPIGVDAGRRPALDHRGGRARPARPQRSASAASSSSASRPRRTRRAPAPRTTRAIIQLADPRHQGRAPRRPRHDRRVPVRVHEPRPLRPAHAPTARSTTTARSSSSRAPPSRTPARAPTSSRPAT